MGIYLNGSRAYTLYKEVVDSPYFVDKSAILSELTPLIGQASKYICITRPRRFGKTVMELRRKTHTLACGMKATFFYLINT